MNRCENCDYADHCPLAYIVNFCDDCIDCDNCTIKSSMGCEKGYDIECNNGFEEKNIYDEEVLENE